MTRDGNQKQYATGRKISGEEMEALKITQNDFHGEWNYTFKPRKKEGGMISSKLFFRDSYLLLVTLVIGALSLRCASDEAATDDGFPLGSLDAPIPTTLPALTADLFLALRANVECSRLLRCPASDAAAAQGAFFGQYADCRGRVDLLPSASHREQQRAFAREGRMTFDASAARRCLDALRASPCIEPLTCARVFTGAIPLGGSCTHDDTCAGDARCDTNTCPGVCVVRFADGERCFNVDNYRRSVCASDGASGPLDCSTGPGATDFLCRALPTLPEGSGSRCLDLRDNIRARACAEQSTCVAYGDRYQQYGYCEAVSEGGARCTDRCRPGFLCVAGAPGAVERSCLRVVVRNREGESCGVHGDGLGLCNLTRGLSCDGERCRGVGMAAAGAPCFTNYFGDLSNCGYGLWCDRDTARCQPQRRIGEPCGEGSRCLAGGCYQPDRSAPGTCVLPQHCVGP